MQRIYLLTSLLKSSLASTIAIRYATVRRQGNKHSDGLERQIINYPSVYNRLLPILSRAYTFILLGRNLVRPFLLVCTELIIFSGNGIYGYDTAFGPRRYVPSSRDACYHQRTESPCHDVVCAGLGDSSSRVGRTRIQCVRRDWQDIC